SFAARGEFGEVLPKTIRNDFGGTFGGPIFKDKTFFFGSLVSLRSILGGTSGDMMETQDFENYVTTNFPNSMATRFFQAAPPVRFGAPVYDPNGVNSMTVAQIEANYSSPYTPPNIPGTMVAEAYEFVPTDAINNGFQGHLRIDHN